VYVLDIFWHLSLCIVFGATAASTSRYLIESESVTFVNEEDFAGSVIVQ
jgi:hypothetical protein